MKAKKFLVVALSVLMLASCGNKTSVVYSVAASSEATSSVVSENSSAASSAASSETSSETSSPVSSETSSETSSPVSSESSTTSSESSTSVDDGTTTIFTQEYPGKLGLSANVSVGSEGYRLDNVFTLMSGTTIDIGSKKDVTYDGNTFSSGGRFKFNGVGSITAKSIQINATSAGTLRFCCQGANSSDTSRTWSVADKDGNILFTSAAGVLPTAPDYYTYEITAAGTYYLYSTINGINFYYFDFTQKVKLGTETGFAVNSGNVTSDYLIGDTLSLNGLAVSATYDSGATLALAATDYTVDSSAVDMSKAGTYEIKVTYKSYAVQTFKVTVHAVKSINVYYKVIQTGIGSKTVNRVPEVYAVGGTVTTTSIIVKAVTDTDAEIAVTSKATITAPDTSTAGEKKIAVAYTNNSTNYTYDIGVTVIDKSLLVKDTDKNAYVVNVDPSVAADGTVVSNVMTFKTIQRAHDFLQAAGLADTDQKIINVAAGTYNEKLYIEIPKVKLVGATAATPTSYSDAQVTIQCDYDSDTKDAAGNSFSTYGSSSVTIHSGATGFNCSAIIFKNTKFNSMAEYDACTDGNKQACALLNEADKSLFYYCSFYGYQDTLYARSNAQAYGSCYIEGMTDYIFGEEADVLIEDSTIKSLYRNSDTNGGYICAPKSAATTKVGFYFMNCNITAEDKVVDGTVSLARPWASTAKCGYFGCTLSKAISTKAYGDTSSSKNARWEQMSGNLPQNASFVEYGNTGDGAITTAVNGGTVIDKTAFDATYEPLFESVFLPILNA